MKTAPTLRLVCPDAHDQSQHDVCCNAPPHNPKAGHPLRKAILRAREHLLALQDIDGSWSQRRPLELSVQVDWMLLHLACQQQSSVVQRLASHLRESQLDTGGWSCRMGDDVDMDVSVKAYLALKLLGCSAGELFMRRASRAIRAAGGATEADATIRQWIDYFALPSSTTAVCVNELFTSSPVPTQHDSLEPVAVATEVSRLTGRAVTSLLQHGPRAGATIHALQELDRRVEIDGDSCQVQLTIPGNSLELTSLAVRCCIVSGLPANHIVLQSAAAWLTQELSTLQEGEDIQTRCHVLMGLDALRATESAPTSLGLPPAMSLVCDPSIQESSRDVKPTVQGSLMSTMSATLVDDILSRQQVDGGWSDQAGGGDPLLTGQVLHALAGQSDRRCDESMQQGVQFLRAAHQFDGSWSTDGVNNRVAATASAIAGIAATGMDVRLTGLPTACDWLLAAALPGGGWCEQGRAGQGDVALTATAIGALTTAGLANDAAVADAMGLLLELQRDDGSWGVASSTSGPLPTCTKALLALSHCAARCGTLEVVNRSGPKPTAKVVASYSTVPQDCA